MRTTYGSRALEVDGTHVPQRLATGGRMTKVKSLVAYFGGVAAVLAALSAVALMAYGVSIVVVWFLVALGVG